MSTATIGGKAIPVWSPDRSEVAADHPVFKLARFPRKHQTVERFVVDGLGETLDRVHGLLGRLQAIPGKYADYLPEKRRERAEAEARPILQELRNATRQEIAKRQGQAEFTRNLLREATAPPKPVTDADRIIARLDRQEALDALRARETPAERLKWASERAQAGDLRPLYAALEAVDDGLLPANGKENLQQVAENIALRQHPWLGEQLNDVERIATTAADVAVAAYWTARDALAGELGPGAVGDYSDWTNT